MMHWLFPSRENHSPRAVSATKPSLQLDADDLSTLHVALEWFQMELAEGDAFGHDERGRVLRQRHGAKALDLQMRLADLTSR